MVSKKTVVNTASRPSTEIPIPTFSMRSVANAPLAQAAENIPDAVVGVYVVLSQPLMTGLRQ